MKCELLNNFPIICIYGDRFMTARVSDYRNSVYHREYANDVPKQTELLQRVACAALPFLSLHRAFRLPLSLGMGCLRVWNTEDTFQRAGAVVSLVSTVFQHRAGQVLTTIQDIILEIQGLQSSHDQQEACTRLIKILNQLLYLGVISYGGLELTILSLAIQATLNLIQAKDEFGEGRWIEGVANFFMAGVRLEDTYRHCQQLKRNWEIEAAMKRVYVGELHEKWRFPSDHLPVGIEVNGVRVISWNVLNGVYMEWVDDKDSQGLKGSLISQLNQPVGSQGLTQRDILVAEMVQQMMSQGQMVALQECSAPFLGLLKQQLPSDWEMVKSFNKRRLDQDIILYNRERLTYCPESSEVALSAYPVTAMGRPLQNAFFSQNATGEGLRIINGHIPGDPAKPGCEEFARYVHQQHRPGDVTVALGDNNFERAEMMEAYRKAGFSEFSLHSPWTTNIDPASKESKGIDSLFVVGEHVSRDLRSDEVLVGDYHLQETIDLLATQR